MSKVYFLIDDIFKIMHYEIFEIPMKTKHWQ